MKKYTHTPTTVENYEDGLTKLRRAWWNGGRKEATDPITDMFAKISGWTKEAIALGLEKKVLIKSPQGFKKQSKKLTRAEAKEQTV